MDLMINRTAVIDSLLFCHFLIEYPRLPVFLSMNSNIFMLLYSDVHFYTHKKFNI